MKTRTVIRSVIGATLLSLVVVLGGCEENPAVTETPGDCEHVDADGLRLKDEGGDGILDQWEGTNSGDVDVAHEETRRIEVVFLDPDQEELTVGADCPQVLRWEIEDETILTIAAVDGQPWHVDVTGDLEGETEVSFLVTHGDHDDFRSQPIEFHVTEEGELDVDGMILRMGSTDLVTVDEGVVTGQLDVDAGASTGTIDVFFVDHDGNEFQPDASAGFDLSWTVDNEALVTYEELGDWSFRLDGISGGSTTISFEILHEGHSDFSSPAIDIQIQGPPPPSPQALLLLDGEQWVATWYYDAERPAQATGPLYTFEGEARTGLSARFLDSDRDPIAIPSAYRVGFELADAGVMTVTPSGEAPEGFRVDPVATGSTTVRVSLVDPTDTTVWTSGNIPVLVLPATGTDPTPTFQLRKNGRTDVGVIDGVLTPVDDEVCSSKVWDAAFKADTGQETELYSVRYFNDACERIDLTSSHTLLFDFADRGIATSTNHPKHWGEITVFHINGLAAGTTSMRLVLLRNYDEVVFVSPPIPVEIGEIGA